MSRPSDFRTTAAGVIAVEVLCILALWWVGRVFGA
jgi:hypothetical protein